jgi:hypothetical protein
MPGQPSEITRRTILTSAAATAAAVAAGPLNAQAPAPPAPTPPPEGSIAQFMQFSSALTGIAEKKLAPGVDPIGVGKEYFTRAQMHPAYSRLASLYAGNNDLNDPEKQKFIDALKREPSNADLLYLARSIVLAWYLGSWYEPDELRKQNPAGPPQFISSQVISSRAYSQGWAWRIAQAHPMGYSELQYGYWNVDPPALANPSQFMIAGHT